MVKNGCFRTVRNLENLEKNMAEMVVFFFSRGGGGLTRADCGSPGMGDGCRKAKQLYIVISMRKTLLLRRDTAVFVQ